MCDYIASILVNAASGITALSLRFGRKETYLMVPRNVSMNGRPPKRQEEVVMELLFIETLNMPPVLEEASNPDSANSATPGAARSDWSPPQSYTSGTW